MFRKKFSKQKQQGLKEGLNKMPSCFFISIKGGNVKRVDQRGAKTAFRQDPVRSLTARKGHGTRCKGEIGKKKRNVNRRRTRRQKGGQIINGPGGGGGGKKVGPKLVDKQLNLVRKT